MEEKTNNQELSLGGGYMFLNQTPSQFLERRIATIYGINSQPIKALDLVRKEFSANERLKLIRDILPNAKKIGVIYCTSEVNATQSLKELKDLAYNYDFEIVEKGVAAASDIALATNNIVKDVDCICLVIDNTVSASLPNIIEIATNNRIPVFCNEEDEVKLGGLACNGIDYKSLGIETGKIAAQILKGEKKANEIEYKCIEDTILYVNSETFDKLNINLPNQLKDNCIDVIESK